jgi:hypothetical protein
MTESLPGQLPLFCDDEADAPFKLSDDNVELLREVNELSEAAARGLLFLVLCIMFAQDAAESVENQPSVERITPRSQLLPGGWLRRNALWI